MPIAPIIHISLCVHLFLNKNNLAISIKTYTILIKIIYNSFVASISNYCTTNNSTVRTQISVLTP